MSTPDETFADDLQAALQVSAAGPELYRAEIPDGWQQGRGAFGGLVLGILANAMEQHQGEPERTLRSLSGEILAPVQPGPAEVRVELLRKGSGMTSVSARMRQGGEVLAHASAIFSRARSSDRSWLTLAPPMLKPWQDVEVVPVTPPFGPHFARAFEYRPTGALPFSGGEPAVDGWVRAKRPLARFSAPALVAYIDAYWPTAYAVEEGPRPMATVAFTFQLLADPAQLSPERPLFHRARSPASREGYFVEVRELWSPEGQLVALNPQTFAVIR